jgi:YgiT-type zinc finger domain-containing protein
MNRTQPNGLIAEQGESEMSSYRWQETLVECKVTYTLEMKGQLIVVENVPARVNMETGEQLFSPDTVEHLQQVIWAQKQPKRVIQVPVYEFA